MAASKKEAEGRTARKKSVKRRRQVGRRVKGGGQKRERRGPREDSQLEGGQTEDIL
jgi:hypothetical protein